MKRGCYLKEQEIKIMLSHENYELLCREFAWEEAFSQINFYYLDTQNYLLNHDVTVRVRYKNNLTKLQIKTPIDEKGNIRIREEFEKKINYIPTTIEGTELSEVTGIDLPDCKLVGSMTTQRKILNINDMELCLDLNIYKNVIDYELEIEFLEEIEETILKKLTDLGIDVNKKGDGKMKRFMKSI